MFWFRKNTEKIILGYVAGLTVLSSIVHRFDSQVYHANFTIKIDACNTIYLVK